MYSGPMNYMLKNDYDVKFYAMGFFHDFEKNNLPDVSAKLRRGPCGIKPEEVAIVRKRLLQ
jgi:hypothetical protein